MRGAPGVERDLELGPEAPLSDDRCLLVVSRICREPGIEVRRLAAQGIRVTMIGEKQFWKLVETG